MSHNSSHLSQSHQFNSHSLRQLVNVQKVRRIIRQQTTCVNTTIVIIHRRITSATSFFEILKERSKTQKNEVETMHVVCISYKLFKQVFIWRSASPLCRASPIVRGCLYGGVPALLLVPALLAESPLGRDPTSQLNC